MSRPPKCRIVEYTPTATYFKPRGIPLKDLEETVLTVEQLEAIRLCDLKNLSQEEAAVKMGISRQTFGRILTEARKHIADAIVMGKALRIEGGHYQLVDPHKKETTSCDCTPTKDNSDA